MVFTSDEIYMMGSVLLRIVLAAFLGATIGIDRVKKRRPAGIKTHALVCMGSTLVMLTGEFLVYTYGSSTDVARLSAQVISGVGFLGAGTIMVTGRNQIKGLTTAAGLWFSACLGLAIGSGFYIGVFSAIILLFVVVKIFAIYDRHLQKTSVMMDMYVEFNERASVGLILKCLRSEGCQVSELERIDEHTSGNILVFLSIRLPQQLAHQNIIDLLEAKDGITYIEEV